MFGIEVGQYIWMTFVGLLLIALFGMLMGSRSAIIRIVGAFLTASAVGFTIWLVLPQSVNQALPGDVQPAVLIALVTLCFFAVELWQTRDQVRDTRRLSVKRPSGQAIILGLFLVVVLLVTLSAIGINKFSDPFGPKAGRASEKATKETTQVVNATLRQFNSFIAK